MSKVTMATVDGQDAVIDGTVPLIDTAATVLSDEDVLRKLSEAQAAYEAAKGPHRATTEALTAAKKEYERVANVAVAHFRSTRQIAMDFAEDEDRDLAFLHHRE